MYVERNAGGIWLPSRRQCETCGRTKQDSTELICWRCHRLNMHEVTQAISDLSDSRRRVGLMPSARKGLRSGRCGLCGVRMHVPTRVYCMVCEYSKDREVRMALRAVLEGKPLERPLG